jgi:L-lysine 2,3-aminomutase
LESPQELAAVEAGISSAAVDGLNNIIGTNGVAPEQPNERYKAISLQAIDKVAEAHPELKPHLYDVKLAGMVFPFKASPYYVDELVDWKAENVREDPFYKLIFPSLDMLITEHREKLEAAYEEGDPAKLIRVVAEIREDLNPHPAGQQTLNTPKEEALTGVQHKYSETVLVFPAAAQTCHAYCTYVHFSSLSH